MMAISVKQLEKKVCFSQEETRMLQTTNKEHMRCYCEMKTVVGRIVRKLVNSAATRCFVVAMLITKTV